ncbi:MAG: non-homologous end-joining DNA ligase, partial [Actinocatenispora sp.]
MAEERRQVRVDGRRLSLSNLDKVLYPDTGFTKGEVIDFYVRIADVLLPHLVDRPVTVIRFPDGVDGQSFFAKNAPSHTPTWVRTVRLPAPSSTSPDGTVDYVVVRDLATLVWLANLAALEFHVPQWRIGPRGAARSPDLLVIDLDPGPPAGLPACLRVAALLRDRLADDGLTAYPKTSGRKGMQLLCPVSGRQSADVVAGYAKTLATELAREHPDLVVDRMAKDVRGGKVFLDWSQNNAAKTTVAPYSLRALSSPTVSTPLTWDEVVDGTSRRYDPEQALSRVARHGDLMAGLADGGPEVPTGRAAGRSPARPASKDRS